ncbi:Transposon Ty3-G Gag-Pol polyprotein [Sesbania bispinosa]|nr:Transposon Ty3-G Gag-Pol polyprotein [Sesbania bispinosa]
MVKFWSNEVKIIELRGVQITARSCYKESLKVSKPGKTELMVEKPPSSSDILLADLDVQEDLGRTCPTPEGDRRPLQIGP